jgi:hypothetical protein
MTIPSMELRPRYHTTAGVHNGWDVVVIIGQVRAKAAMGAVVWEAGVESIKSENIKVCVYV